MTDAERTRISRARARLVDFAEVLEKLKPHLNTNGGADVQAAWDVARERFLAACREYATALTTATESERVP